MKEWVCVDLNEPHYNSCRIAECISSEILRINIKNMSAPADVLFAVRNFGDNGHIFRSA